MTSEAERYARIHAVFEEARALSGSARDELLAARCGDDAQLRREVGELLALLEQDSGDAFSDTGIAGARHALEALADDAAADPAGREGWLPERVGPYRVIRRIAEGGMGVVYEAEQDSPRRRVALKVVHPLFASPARLKRFRQEAELLGRLHHPGIAQIHAAGTFDLGRGPQPYIAMEHVEGGDLASYASSRKLPPRARLELLAAVCDAVQHAHEMGVIHRDLKPDNVLVDARGQPRVLDFGVARAAEGSTVLTTLVTEEGDLLGTIAYMAPEQLEGVPEAITARADVYALGAIAFELLAGRLPHDVLGLPLAAALQIVRDREPPRLGELRPELRGDVETVVGKALEKEPARRYASAADLAADLRAILEHRPIAARPPSRIYRARKFTRRHKGLVGGVAVALLALALGATASLVFAVRAEDSARRAREGERRAVAGVLQAVQDDLDRGELWSAARTWLRVLDAPGGWERALVARALPELVPPRYASLHVAWADDEHLVVKRPAGGLAFVAVDGWREVGRLLEGRAVDALFQFREGTAWASVGPEPGLVYLDLARRRVVRELRPPGEGHVGLRAAAAVAADPPVELWRDADGPGWTVLRGGELAARLPAAVGVPYLSPDGRTAAFLDNGAGRLRVFDALAGTERGAVDGLRRSSCARARFRPPGARELLTPGSRELLTLDAASRLVAIDLDRAVVSRRFDVVAEPCGGFSLSSDGRLAAVEAGEPSAVVVDLETEERIYAATVGLLPDGSCRLKLSPDGTRVLVAAMDVGTVLLDLGEPPPTADGLGTDADPRALTYRGHGSYVYDHALSPDGRLVASSSPAEPRVLLWDRGTGETVAELEKPVEITAGPDNRGHLLAFSADGRRVLATVRSGVDAPCLFAWDLLSGGVAVEPPASGQSAKSHLPWLDRFPAVLGPAPAMRLGRMAWLADDGTALAVQPHGVWKVPVGERWRAFAAARNEHECLAPSPGGRRVAVGEVRALRIYDRASEQILASFPGRAYAVAWSPDGRLVAAGGEDGRIRLVDPDLREVLLAFRAHDDYVFSLSWTPDGAALVSTSGDGTVRVWDPRPGAARAAEVAAHRARLAQARRLDDEGIVAAFEAARSDAERGALVRVALERRRGSSPPPSAPVEAGAARDEVEPLVTFRGHTDYVYAVAVSPDGRLAASLAVRDPLLRVWDLATGEPVATLDKAAGTSGAGDNRDHLLAFADDGRTLLATARDGAAPPRLIAWDLASGERTVEELPAGLLDPTHLAWLDRVAARLDDAGGPRRLGRRAALVADGTPVALRPPEGLDVPAGERWRAVAAHLHGEGLAVAPGDDRIAVVSRGSLRVLEPGGGERVLSWERGGYAVAWSPDGTTLAVGDEGGELRLVDVATGAVRRAFRAHDRYVFALAWTPDGARLVTASGDATVKVWDARAVELAPPGASGVPGATGAR